jgi:hypothetical protein
MHTFTIHQTGQTFSFPSDQDEMNGKQRIVLITGLLLYNMGKLSYFELKLFLLKNYLNVKTSLSYKHFSAAADKLKAAENFNRLADCLDSLFHGLSPDRPSPSSINLESPKQFLPVISVARVPRVTKHKFYGPESGFADLTFYEFRTASYYYAQYIQNNKEGDLDRLIATLYRPGKKFWHFKKQRPDCNGIRRIPISAETNPSCLEKRALRLSKLPFPVKYTILLYCSGCFAFIRTGRPEIDGKEINLERLYVNEPDGESIGMSGLLFSIAESGIFGSIKETDQQNIYTIFARMYQLMLQEEEMKRKFKANDKN